MALQRFNDDLNIIAKLGDNPRTDDGLSTQGFKAKFDEAALKVQLFINNVLIPGIENTVSEDGLLAQIAAALSKKLDLSGGTMTGAINMNGQKLTGLNDPTTADEVARKGYVDAAKVAANNYTNEQVKIASPFNCADNSDFTQFVAQAGIGGNHGTQAYAGDRWILDSGTVTGEAREDGNGYTNITLNGTIRQIVANPPDVGTVAIEMVSGTATISYADGEITISSSGGVIKNVRLFEGEYTADNLPVYQPKGYGAELAECKMYYKYFGNVALPGIAVADATIMDVVLSEFYDMRTKNPSITGEIQKIYGFGKYNENILENYSLGWHENYMRILFASAPADVSNLQSHTVYFKKLALSADL